MDDEEPVAWCWRQHISFIFSASESFIFYFKGAITLTFHLCHPTVILIGKNQISYPTEKLISPTHVSVTPCSDNVISFRTHKQPPFICGERDTKMIPIIIEFTICHPHVIYVGTLRFFWMKSALQIKFVIIIYRHKSNHNLHNTQHVLYCLVMTQ